MNIQQRLSTLVVATLCAYSVGCGASHDVALEGSQRNGQTGQPSAAGASFAITDIGAPVAIAGDFQFPEGPIWSPEESALYFSDIDADTISRLTLPDQIEVVMKPAQHPDGLALDPEGAVIVAGYVSRSVWKLDGDQMHTLADSQDGKKLNSPDDLTVRSDGVVYFTDPTFGLIGSLSFASQTAELDVQGIYRIDTDGQLHLEDSSQPGPNGIALAPDENRLYVSYTLTGEIDAFTVNRDGTLADRRVFVANALGADSMTVDKAGNVYVATGGGIAVYTPQGAAIGTIALPDLASNVAFGGPDQRTLFITARAALQALGLGAGSLYRIDDMPVPGLPGKP